MDHVWEANASASPPPAPVSPLVGYPSETGSPTQPGAWWFYMLTEEIRNAIIAGGGTPAFGTVNQLAAVINSKAGFLDAQQNNYAISAAGGTSDAITGSYTPAIAAVTNGMSLMIRSGSANTTTTPTFSPNGLTAKAIVKGAGATLSAGDIAGGGHWVELQYDLTLDKWVLLNPATGTATITAINDSGFADNSAKPASTSWVRGAMSAIAIAAGFAASITANGYVKFPTWLGAWVIQWGGIAQSSLATGLTVVGVTYPVTFPNNVYVTIPAATGGGYSFYAGCQSGTTSGFNLNLTNNAGAPTSIGAFWIAIGK